MQGLWGSVLKHVEFFFPWKSLQVERAVHFQTVISKSAEADPSMFSKDISVFLPPH